MKPVIAFSLLACAVLPAHAADLGVPRPDTQISPSPVATRTVDWTGFYAGLNGGFGWTSPVTAFVHDAALDKNVAHTSERPAGFIGGAQVGYNWLSGLWLFGVEADLQYANLGGAIDWGTYKFLNLKSGEGQYFGTLRARLGYAMGRSLLYVTGGFAYGGLIDDRFTGSAIGNAGYALGGGFEYALMDNWTVRVEGLYVGFEGKSKTLSLENGVYSVHATPVDGAGLIRAGVNYKF